MDEANAARSRISSLSHGWTREGVTFGLVVAATLAVWGHTIDEVRIGELSAVPAGILNLGLLASWRRLPSGWRGALAVLFGLFWTLTVIPYHVVPLVQGVVTWQNISGLLRVVGGVAMTAAGIQVLCDKRRSHDTGP